MKTKQKSADKPLPSTAKLAASISKRYAQIEAAQQKQHEEAKEDVQFVGGYIAQDPVAALFAGIRFRNKADRGVLESKVREYCYQQIGSNWKASENKFDVERSSLRAHIRDLESALARSKDHCAEEIRAALQQAHRIDVGFEVMALGKALGKEAR